nr:MAG TPA: hypothetical protein [Caudoviricetes sp.]
MVRKLGTATKICLPSLKHQHKNYHKLVDYTLDIRLPLGPKESSNHHHITYKLWYSIQILSYLHYLAYIPSSYTLKVYLL